MKADVELLIDKAEESLSAARMLLDRGYHGFAEGRVMPDPLCCLDASGLI